MTSIPQNTPTSTARSAIGEILDGSPPNDHRPDEMGKFSDVYTEMTQAHSQGGTEAARIVYLKYADIDPDVAALRAAEPETEIPSTIQRWPIRTLADAYQERPPIHYIVDGLFAAASLSVAFGAPGSLKSMVLADLCCCVAAGHDWLQPIPNFEPAPKPVRTNQGSVLWIDFDNGTRRTDERFDALARARGLPADAPINYVSMPQPWLDASSAIQVAHLAELIQHLSAEIVVIDNLGLITGGVDENSAEMAGVMGNLRWLADTTQAAIIIIHHQRKGAVGGGAGRAGDTIRGSSTIEAALDIAMLIERTDGTDDIAISTPKARGPRGGRLAATFTYTHREGTQDLGEARFFGTVTDQTNDKIAIDQIVSDVLQDSEGMSQTALIAAVRESMPDVGDFAIRTRIKQLANEKILTVTQGARNAKIYALANGELDTTVLAY